MVTRMILDVDGVINLPEGLKDTVPGVTFQVDRLTSPNGRGNRFPVEETLNVATETINFLHTMWAAGVEIWWLTGWKDNAQLLDPHLGIKSSGWIEWDNSSDEPILRLTEKGKNTAVNTFLATHPDTTCFVWVDDIATQHKVVSSIQNMQVITNYNTGLTGNVLEQVKQFLVANLSPVVEN